MEVTITLHVPDGKGDGFDIIAVREAVDARSQHDALENALRLVAESGWPVGLVAGVSVDPGWEPRNERVVEGGLEGALRLLADRREAENLLKHRKAGI